MACPTRAIVVDARGRVVDRSFEEGYVARRTARSLAARRGGRNVLAADAGRPGRPEHGSNRAER
jgi:hypothetical protein